MKERNSTKYQICNTLATGGTAILYKAIQTSLDRPVVIKKLHAHLLADPTFTRRFETEAKAVASLDHENIVRIIDYGSSEGAYTIVMEYIDGVSLKDVLSSRKILGDKLTLLIAREICLGLDHAHQRGIIHRDIKPANIMITSEGQVKITDFGLAKLHQSETQMTVASTLLGTPLYMSPEQAIGEAIDGRSDLFSLGTICYEAMTGTQPFLAENYAAVIQNIVTGAVPPPSRIRRDMDPAAESIVVKALHREPGKRFRNALEMARAIESAIGQETILSGRERLRRLVAGESDVAPAPLPGRSAARGAKKRLMPLSLVAAAAAAAAIIMALTPAARERLTTALKEIRERDPLPAPGEMIISAGQEEGGFDITGFPLEAAPLNESAPAAPDTAAAGDGDPTESAAGGAAETGTILENAGRRFILANVDSVRRIELEKAGRIRGTELRIEKPPASAPVAAAESKSAPPSAPSRIEAPATGFLDIAVDPPAEICIDGRRRYYGSRLAMLELPEGAHEIVCRADGRREYIETVRIRSGELSRRNIDLAEITGSILFETERGAQIFVDGSYRGTVPLAEPLSVPAGPHRVEIKKTGFQTWTNDAYVPPDETLRLSISLVPLSSAK